jgi:hypothetical protein
MRLEHDISKDSASPSSIEKTEIISVHEAKKKFMPTYFKLKNEWTNDLQNEEEPELEKSPERKGIVRAVAYPIVEDQPSNISEIFNYSKDSAFRTP